MTAEPLYFGSAERPLFGWLHRPEKPREHALGVLVLPPFGYEALCAHRSLRHLADALAAASLPVLRLDYDGSGNSAGSDWDPGRLAAWVASVHAAADALRTFEGVEHLCFVGLRLGATLGALAAAARSDVAALTGIVPVRSGRAYVRELNALQVALGLAEPPEGAAHHDSIQEAVGFVLTAETRAAVGAIDLATMVRPPAGAVLLVERDDLPPDDAWPSRLHDLGARVERLRLPGYPNMVLDPHKAEVPQEMFAAVVAFAREIAAAVPATPRRRRAIPQPVALLPPAFEGGLAIEERPVWIDGTGRLFGVLTRPRGGEPTGLGIVWLNAGAVSLVGPNRMHVAAARRWASRGHAVLRLDVSGIGDSPPRDGEPENVVYTERAREDTGAAIAWMRGLGVARVELVGLCSGAYNAFKAAVAGQGADGIVAVNQAVFFWHPGMSLDFKYLESRVIARSSQYARSALQPASWKRLLRGGVDVRAVAQMLARRGAGIARDWLRDAGRLVGRPVRDDLGHELALLLERGTDLGFVFCDREPGLEILLRRGGSACRELLRRRSLEITVIDGPDHTFTPLWSQEKLEQVLDDHFARRAAVAATPRAANQRGA